VALLTAILILLLISVVAISLVVASRTESALTGNYRSSTSVYYAGMAGLEEARGRMLTKNPDYFNNTVPGFVPPAGALLPLGQVRYILNPLPGEVVAPTNLASATTYPDNEYQQEFGVPVPGATTQTIASVSTQAGIQGPLYKWVRITAATEKSIGVDVDNDGLANDNAIPLFFDNSHLNGAGALQPSLVVNAAPPPSALQALEITSLAVLPNGSKKLLQYIVTPVTYNLNFPSALTLTGSQVNFNGANSNQYFVNGTDGSGNPPAVPGCVPNAPSVPAVGVTNAADVNTVINGTPGTGYTGIPGNRTTHYTGGTPPIPSPSVGNISGSLNVNLQSTSSLNTLVQNITANADLVIPGNATQANMPASMAVNNPMTVVVDGDFSMTGNFTGYGLLVVTGNFAYSGTTGWNGIVLVIGSGTTTFLGSGGGNNGFTGAIYAATIKDAQGNLLPNLGVVNFDISGGGGNGVYFNSCWIKNAQQPPTFRVLSFREIPY
jgi:hypothetical protein